MKSYKLKGAIKFILGVGILIFLVYILLKNLRTLNRYDYHINYFYLISSFLVFLLATVFLHANWYFITRSLDCNLGIIKSLTVRIKSELGKYIPGRILGYGYLIVYYKGENKDQLRVLSSSIYELYLSTFSSFLFFTIIHIFISFKSLDAFKVIFIIISLIGILALHPIFFQKISDLLCRLLKRARITYSISFAQSLGLLVLYLVYWLLFSFAFFLFVKSFTDAHASDIFYLSGSFAISALAGFLAFFIPAGLGAREGALVYLLSSLTGNTIAIIISVSSRIWIIIGDLVLFICALIIGFSYKREDSK